MHHEAYVWQRAWDGAVSDALTVAAPKLDRFVALGAEVAFAGGRLRVVMVPVDYKALRTTGNLFGVALRVGAYRGPFDPNDEETRMLCDLAATLVKESGFDASAPAVTYVTLGSGR